jgi:DNA polymerase-3 subunit delta
MPAPAPPRDLATELRRGELAPVYWLHGKERYLLMRALEALRAAAVEPATRAFNEQVVDARAAGAAVIVAAARTLPMMARRRLVIVRGIDDLRAEGQEQLVSYVAEPSPETVLVLVSDRDRVDLRGKLAQAVKRRGGLIGFEPLRDRELPGFVQAEVRARAAAIERPAAQLLCDLVGADLGALAQAVEKLTLYVGARPISEDDVAACIAHTRAGSVFELVDAVGRGDRERALRLWRKMAEDREEPLRVLGMLARHFRQLWQTRELTRERAGKSEIASAIGLNPYFVEGMVEQARRFSPAALARAFEALYQADRGLKSTRMPDELLLERLVARLAS